MRNPSRFLFPALALVTLAGCASTPAPVVVVSSAAPITVSCTEDALSDAPCVAMARRQCREPQVDTIRLVLTTPVAMPVAEGTYTKQRYDYRATYSCPMSVTSADEK
jgi:hypothetical protein